MTYASLYYIIFDELLNYSSQRVTFLCADVVGILNDSEYNLMKLINSNEVEQFQLRFTLTDGRYQIKTIFHGNNVRMS